MVWLIRADGDRRFLTAGRRGLVLPHVILSAKCSFAGLREFSR